MAQEKKKCYQKIEKGFAYLSTGSVQAEGLVTWVVFFEPECLPNEQKWKPWRASFINNGFASVTNHKATSQLQRAKDGELEPTTGQSAVSLTKE